MESKRKSSVGWIALIIGLLIWWGVSYDNSNKPNVNNSSNFSTEQTTGVVQQSTNTSASPTPSLDYYNNVSGNTVHSPAYSSDGSTPTGATAQCNDGTYSFSQHRSGTCSYHGGVLTWY